MGSGRTPVVHFDLVGCGAGGRHGTGRRSTAGYDAQWQTWCLRLSRLATLALSLILVSGALLASRMIVSPLAISQTTYGQLLLGKLSLVALAAALGAYNRWRFLPQIGALPHMALTGFARVARVEALVLIGVHIMAVILSHTMPS